MKANLAWRTNGYYSLLAEDAIEQLAVKWRPFCLSHLSMTPGAFRRIVGLYPYPCLFDGCDVKVRQSC